MSDLVDAWRIVFGVAAILLSILIVRVAYLRVKRGAYSPTPDGYLRTVSKWTSASYIMCLMLLTAEAWDNMGEPPRLPLIVGTVAVICGWVGLSRRTTVKVPKIPPIVKGPQ